jgi:type IV pilus assembly protein PilB
VHELTTHYGFPYLPLSRYEFDNEVVQAIPFEVARHYCVIPIDKINNVLTVAMANPLNTEAQKEIQHLTGCTILVMVAKASEIRGKIDECHRRFGGLSEEAPN